MDRDHLINPVRDYKDKEKTKKEQISNGVKVTLAVHKVADLFPKEESLGLKIKELANEILADLILLFETNPQPGPALASQISWKFSVGSLIEKIGALEGYFKQAEIQNLADCRNFLILAKEYRKIKEEVGKLEEISKFEPKFERVLTKERLQRILKILKEKERAQVWELKKIFPEVTKRTLRRDLEQLLEQGLIERLGERNATFYRLRRV